MDNIKKILILVPGSEARGGITGYYQTLKKYFNLPVEYFERGSREWPNRKNTIRIIYRTIRDYIIFYKKIRTGDYSLLQTTTSFSSYSIIRDAIFILIARHFKVKIIVFFHGWKNDFSELIENRFLRIFKSIYFKSQAIIDLSKQNLVRLQTWGYSGPLFLETTVVDISLISELTSSFLDQKYYVTQERYNILYLARLEKAKGIYETIETYAILKKKYPYLQLTIAGDGSEESKVKEYIKDLKIQDIVFTGFVNGQAKIDLFKNSHIYILLSYSEGMPTTLLEAMAFGLPIITRPVGGIPDFFINGYNGYYNESKNPLEFAKIIENLFSDPPKLKEIALENYLYACDHFLSDKVVKRIECIFRDILDI